MTDTSRIANRSNMFAIRTSISPSIPNATFGGLGSLCHEVSHSFPRVHRGRYAVVREDVGGNFDKDMIVGQHSKCAS